MGEARLKEAGSHPVSLPALHPILPTVSRRFA